MLLLIFWQRRTKMKNAKKLVLAALMVAMMAVTLCSCGGANIDGTYVVFEADGKSVDEAVKAYEAMGQSITAEEICTMSFTDGKNFSMTVMGQTMGTGTYEVSGETLKLTADNQTIDATIKDGVITITANGQNMKLKKK